MTLRRRLLGWGIGVVWIALVSCDRNTLQRTFSADPKATQWSAATTMQLPSTFPIALKYPGAALSETAPISRDSLSSTRSPAPALSSDYQTQWSTPDGRDQVLAFYRSQLQRSPWTGFTEVLSDGSHSVLSAQQPDQQISVSIPQRSSSGTTESSTLAFTITVQGKASTEPSTNPNAETPAAQSSLASGLLSDVSQVPLALQPYVKDVAELNLLMATPGTINQPVSRAVFARWLVDLNNRIYRDRPARQLRLAGDAKAAFLDVPKTHPDFAYIQGLAEAGYVPSPLSGDKTQTRFRPNDPLTRETLLLWKVPIDRQQILPTVASERVKQLWGFKDINRVMPSALSAMAADHQNGDLSNIRRVLGSTLLFQPQKIVTQAEAIAALWFIGTEGDSLSVQDLLRSEQQTNATTTSIDPSPDSTPDSSP